MKRLIIVLCCILMTVGIVSAYETTPADFDDDELMAADRFNDWNEIVKKSLGTIEPGDLVGTWSVTSIMHRLFALADADMADDWVKVDGLYAKLEDATITFADDGDGTYSLTTSNPNPFNAFKDNQPSETSNYGVCNNTLVLKDGRIYFIQYVNPYCYILHNDHPFGDYAACTLMLTKTVQPPDSPKRLFLEINGLNVTLSWNDDSDSEVGFNIYRKDKVTKTWSLLDTVGPGVVEYIDTVPEAGTYYYRIRAYLMDGDDMLESRGSNVELGKVE